MSNRNPRGWWTDTVGHTPKCKLAKALIELGQPVQMERENTHPNRRKMDRLDEMFLEAHIKRHPNDEAVLRQARIKRQ